MSTKSILDMIRERQGMTPAQRAKLNKEREFKRAPLTKDDWQEFKRKFVEEYGDEKVQDTGMTHSEFLRYMKDSYREGADPYTESQKLIDFLRRL